ncbi:hypothetical protein [Nostoc sp.]|uniref:hypothetical protein n=1 Tax=Nostoc sp. TaxID=1180 RepID=UPI003593E288
MTPSVADKTPIPAKIWRRHTDPPGLWISIVIGSVSLHLLAFWLMRSSNAFSLWFPQQSQSAVPIELIDIAPKTKSTAKTVSPKQLSTVQKSVPARSPQTARTTSINQNFGAINSADNLQQKSRTYASQPNSQPFRQQTVPKPEPKLTAIATPTPKPTVAVGNLPWNQRQEIKLGKGTLLPTGVPSNPPVSEPENRETPRTLPEQTSPTRPTPTPETSPTPTRETQPTPTPETSPTSTQGASVAVVLRLPRDEMVNLIKTKRVVQDPPPDLIAEYNGRNTKQLDSSFLPRDSELKPAQILASLEIDQNGNFKGAVVIEIEPATLQSEKSTYERVLNEVFKTENFSAGKNNDGTKPPSSNLFVQIDIQPANSN